MTGPLSALEAAHVAERISSVTPIAKYGHTSPHPCWFIISVVNGSAIIAAEGDAPTSVLASLLSPDSVQFVLYRVVGVDPRGGVTSLRPKLVGITWQGAGATRRSRASSMAVKSSVQAYLRGHHVWLELFDAPDLNDGLIESKLRSAGGAHAPQHFKFGEGEYVHLHTPAVTTSTPAVTTPTPAVTTSTPAVTTSTPAVTTSTPAVTTSTPAVAVTTTIASNASTVTASLATRLAHFACSADSECGALIPPLHLSTTFTRAADLTFPSGYVYSRWDNPTRSALQAAIASIEGGQHGYAFGSGMAALSALLQSCPKGCVIYPSDTYHGLRALIQGTYVPWGMTAMEVDMRDAAALEVALKRGQRDGFGGTGAPLLLHIETPSNPRVFVTDIAACATLGHVYGAIVSVDATWMSPVICTPIALGADVVVHSSTKYLGGHTDVLSGLLVAKSSPRTEALIERLTHTLRIGGAVASPFDCFLVMRGIRSLLPRITQQSASALRVAQYLEAHPRVVEVFYPGLKSHPGYAIAAKQMALSGGMLSVRIAGGQAGAVAAAARLKLFTRATSLGGTESLVEHRASVEAAGSTTPDDLLRISIGLEDAEDLIADWRQALQE